MLKELTPKQSDVIIYQDNNGKLSFDVNLFNDTVWLTQKQMSDLFGKSIKTISEHINKIFKEGELKKEVVVRKFRNTTQHGAITGKTQVSNINIYNLDVIISVGYRVKSQRGTEFRIWATNILKSYMMKGFVINKHKKDLCATNHST